MDSSSLIYASSSRQGRPGKPLTCKPMLTADRMREWKTPNLGISKQSWRYPLLVWCRGADFASGDWSNWDNKAKIKTYRKPAGDFMAKPRGDGEVVGGNILSDLAWEDAAVAGQDRHRWWVLDYQWWWWSFGWWGWYRVIIKDCRL